jgi:aspartyl/asparaginyl-tRNA synthetase
MPKVRAKHPGLNVNEASKIVAQHWKALSKEEQDVYRDRATKARDEFKKKYPEEAKAFYTKSTRKAQRARIKK